jgi:hypothetical protein
MLEDFDEGIKAVEIKINRLIEQLDTCTSNTDRNHIILKLEKKCYKRLILFRKKKQHVLIKILRTYNNFE